MGKRFLKMDAINVEKACFAVNNSISFCEDIKLLSEFFDKNGIPDERKTIFFKKGLLNDSVSEFFTGVTFMVKSNTNGTIRAFLNGKNNNLGFDYQVFSFDSDADDCSKKEIMDFCLDLDADDKLYGYINALNEFFVLDMDVDYLFELSKSGLPLSSQRKLYRSRTKK